MKKILLALMLVAFVVVESFAIPAAAPSVAANISMESVYGANGAVIKKGTGWDTLAGVDSTIFASKITIPMGSEYILNRAAITGTGQDSVVAQVVVDSYDANNVFQYRTVVDSFSTANSVCVGEQIAIPFYKTIFGDKFTIKIISTSGAGAGGQQILNSMTLYVRKLNIGWHQLVGN